MAQIVSSIHLSKKRAQFLEYTRKELNLPSREKVIYRMITWFSCHPEAVDDLGNYSEIM